MLLRSCFQNRLEIAIFQTEVMKNLGDFNLLVLNISQLSKSENSPKEMIARRWPSRFCLQKHTIHPEICSASLITMREASQKLFWLG